jgi:hypothetical protein
MTVESRNPLAKVPPRLMAVYLSLALIAVHVILLLGGYLRQSAAARTAEQLQQLQDNMQELNAGEQAELARLEASRDQVRQQVEDLQAKVPDPSQPFPVYARTLDLVDEDIANLIQIERMESDNIQSPAGPVLSESHRLTIALDLNECLQLLGDLEQAGGAGLNLDDININAGEPTCAATINTIGRTGESPVQ